MSESADDKAQAAVQIDRIVGMYRAAMPAESITLEQQRDGFEAVLAQLPVRHNASVTAANYGDVDGYWVVAEGASPSRIGVMVHGGGFVMGSAKGYCSFAAEVSNVTDARVFVVDYRLAPEHPFPAGMDDTGRVLTAAIAEVGPQSCFAVGDSAGGGLVLSALLAMHENGSPVPARVAMVSPLIDLTVSNDSFVELAGVDPICRQAGTRRNAAFYLGGQEPEQVPGAFPMQADLSWMPPTLLLVGGAEVLRDDSRNLADKLRSEGVQAHYREYPHMIHVWPMFASFLPQGQQAFDEIGAFVKARTPENSRQHAS